MKVTYSSWMERKRERIAPYYVWYYLANVVQMGLCGPRVVCRAAMSSPWHSHSNNEPEEVRLIDSAIDLYEPVGKIERKLQWNLAKLMLPKGQVNDLFCVEQ